MRLLRADEARTTAYERAALCKQGSPAHSYWMGAAHAFGTAIKDRNGLPNDFAFVSEEFFTLPPYIPFDKLTLSEEQR